MDEQSAIEETKLLIYKSAHKLKSKLNNLDINDLFQAGCIGVLKALKNYQPDGSTKFSTYAYKYILGEMYELANISRDIKLNKVYLKSKKLIEKARSVLAQKLNRYPTIEEISAFTELEPEFVEEIINITYDTISLDEEPETLNEGYNLYNYIGTTEDVDTQILINDSLEELEEPLKSIINYRYYQDLTQSEIAEIMGLSQVKVSRLENKGKQKIKEYISA